MVVKDWHQHTLFLFLKHLPAVQDHYERFCLTPHCPLSPVCHQDKLPFQSLLRFSHCVIINLSDFLFHNFHSIQPSFPFIFFIHQLFKGLLLPSQHLPSHLLSHLLGFISTLFHSLTIPFLPYQSLPPILVSGGLYCQ